MMTRERPSSGTAGSETNGGTTGNKSATVLILEALRLVGLLLFPLCLWSAQKTVAEVHRMVSRSIVLIVAIDNHGTAQTLGSGVITDPSGEIVTSFHVIGSASTVAAKMWNESILLVEGVAAFDRELDLAILKVKGRDLPAVFLGSAKQLSVGDTVVAISNPLGFEGSLSTGVVSALRRLPGLATLIQTTAPISSGSSGGGLFDLNGNLVGIATSSVLGGQNLNFATSIDHLPQLSRFPSPTPLREVQKPTVREAESPISELAPAVRKAKEFIALEMLDDAQAALSAAEQKDKFNPEVHYYLGEIWSARRNYEKAREKYRIALNLDPGSISILGRLAMTCVNLWREKGDASFRAEAVMALRQIDASRSRGSVDKYSDAAGLATLIRGADSLLRQLLLLTGEWVTADGFVWRFSESDGPLGPQFQKNAPTIGSILIRQVNSPALTVWGYLWRTADLDLEGWYTLSLGRDCSGSWQVKLRESEDGMLLNGAATPTQRRGTCAIDGRSIWNVSLYRK